MIKIIIISKDENASSIEYILKYFEHYTIFLVSPKASLTKYQAKNLNKINDNDILDFNQLKEKLELERFGWYYQQFLKYQVVLTLDGEEFLIIDGDTAIKNTLAKSDTLFTTGKYTVENYSNLYKMLFPNHKLNGNSFVTNQMVFRKSFLKELIGEIEKNNSKNWIEILSCLVKENKNFMFSEYQTYAEYILNRNENIKINPIKVFRRMDLITDSTQNALKKYDILAYENHHKTGILRVLRAKIYYIFGMSIG